MLLLEKQPWRTLSTGVGPGTARAGPAVVAAGEALHRWGGVVAAVLAARATEAHDRGRFQPAADLWRRVAEVAPGHTQPLINRAVSLMAGGFLWAAEGAYEQALARQPGHPGALLGLASVLRLQNRPEEALTVLGKARAVKAPPAQMLAEYGACLRILGHLEQALDVYDLALRITPSYALAHANRAVALLNMGRLDEAEQGFRQALALNPADASAKTSLAMLRLLRGDLPAGWVDYEARWRRPQVARERLAVEALGVPAWAGQPLEGRRILLHAEQGNGDTIQFLRYLPRIAALGARVVLRVPQSLTRLARETGLCEAVIEPTEAPGRLDYHCPLMSLPKVFQDDLTTIPQDVPYLTVPEAARLKAARLFAEETPSGGRAAEGAMPSARPLRVGLVWAGNPDLPNDRLRSISPDLLSALLAVPGASFYSLQMGRGEPPPGVRDVTAGLQDYADTAAVCQSLDLVISVDTSVAHLAGALGCPVWILIAFSPDWRWQLSRPDTPWYPTARLYRQPRIYDWRSVISRICADLMAEVEVLRHGCAEVVATAPPLPGGVSGLS